MKSIFAEIRTDYTDENGVTHLDAFKTDDDMEDGTTIGFVINGEAYYREPEFRFDPLVKEVVAEVQEEHKKRKEELKEEILKVVTSVVYDGDAKPRPEFTNGSPLGVKLSIIREAVDKIMNSL